MKFDLDILLNIIVELERRHMSVGKILFKTSAIFFYRLLIAFESLTSSLIRLSNEAHILDICFPDMFFFHSPTKEDVFLPNATNDIKTPADLNNTSK